MFDPIFLKEVKDFIDSNIINLYLKINNSYPNDIYEFRDKAADSIVWFDLYSEEMNRKDFLKELEDYEEDNFSSKEDFNEYMIIYKLLKDKFGRKGRIKNLLKEI